MKFRLLFCFLVQCILIGQIRSTDAKSIEDCETPEVGENAKFVCEYDSNLVDVSKVCSIECRDGFSFDDGSTTDANFICSNGVWDRTVDKTCNKQYLVLPVEPDKLNIPVNLFYPVLVPSREKESTCATWGQYYYRTFDNVVYNFQGKCTYKLTGDCVDDTFSIHIHNDQECVNTIDCKRSISIYFSSVHVTMELNEDGVAIVRTEDQTLSIPGKLDGLLTERVSQYIIVKSGIGFTVKWNGKDAVIVSVSNELRDKTCGLCGNSNLNPIDDLLDVNGRKQLIVTTFGNSWVMANADGVECSDSSLNYYCTSVSSAARFLAKDFCTTFFNNPEFSSCHGVVQIQPYLELCMEDVCKCNSKTECACSTFESYFRECHRLGGRASWRNKEVCPLSCPSGMVYDDCGSACPETCKSTRYDCVNNECIDGCHCPEGSVLHEGKCITRSECPCTAYGKIYNPGKTIKRSCNKCKCMGGKWSCTDKLCPGVCKATGDPHYKTFDGKKYNFMGDCSYVLATNKSADGVFYSIEAENVECNEKVKRKKTCTKSVTIRYETHNHVMHLGRKFQLIIDDVLIKTFPHRSGGFLVKMASSNMMKVKLDNGLVVYWNGNNRVYIHAKPDFMSKTMGLCGTFNNNQEDDFLTRQGDIETNVIAFGNKWKTLTSCLDLDTEIEIHHPCDVFPQLRAKAEAVCAKLLSLPFTACHNIENVHDYIEKCKYDVCSADENMKPECSTYGDYAKTCADEGVVINWVESTTDCAITCPGDTVYQQCGSSCGGSCDSMETDMNSCVEACVEGCSCPNGLLLDFDQKSCVAASECSCKRDNKIFASGETVRDGCQLCMCVDGGWICQDVPDLCQVNETCPINMHWVQCRSSCPLTCDNLAGSIQCLTDSCEPGCVCDRDMIWDGQNCITSDQCPCYHGGKSFAAGESIKVDCHTCICNGQTWSCGNEQCPGECTAFGDPHFKTFDGKRYDFQGNCEYVLVRSSELNPIKFNVTVENIPCGTSGVTCTKNIVFSVEEDNVLTRVTLVRGISIENLQQYSSQGFEIWSAGVWTFVRHQGVGVELKWDQGTRISVILNPQHQSSVEGLCGNYNGNANDDFTTPEGGPPEQLSHVFGNSWQVHSYCPQAQDINDTCKLHPHRQVWSIKKCGIIKSDIFKPCHSVSDPSHWYQTCVFDGCGCDSGGDCECVCTAIASYAQECRGLGVVIDWRSDEHCPMQCGNCPLEYQACSPACPKTCENANYYNEVSANCSLSCVEGCACPEGQVVDKDGKHCIEVSECEYCTEIDGIKYQEGDTIPSMSDKCRTCYCSQNKVHCMGQPCVVTTTTSTPVTSSSPVTTTTQSTTGSVISTTINLPFTAECIKSGWSDWMNSYYPTLTNQGDLETISSLRQDYIFCDENNITSVECRAVNIEKSSDEVGKDVICSKEMGLICLNEYQTPTPLCLDYEIRFLCDCIEDETTTTKQTYTTTTSGSGITTTSGQDTTTSGLDTTTSSSGTTTSSSVTTTSGSGTTTSGPDTTPFGLDTTTPGLDTTTSGSDTTTSGPDTTTSGSDTTTPGLDTTTTTVSNPETTTGSKKCFVGFTKWMPIDRENFERGSHTIQSLREQYEFCMTPSFIECKTTQDDIEYDQTGQRVTCDLKSGLVCRNSENESPCLDYKIRIFCICQVPTTTPKLEETTKQTTVNICVPGFTNWMSSTTPSSENEGDLENFKNLRSAYDFCESPLKIDCREIETGIRVSDTDQHGVTCDLSLGLACLNDLQENICKDFEVRVFCGCQEATTTLSSTAGPTSLAPTTEKTTTTTTVTKTTTTKAHSTTAGGSSTTSTTDQETGSPSPVVTTTPTTDNGITTTVSTTTPVCVPKWSPWLNTIVPTRLPGSGDYQSINDLPENFGSEFCSRNMISSIECVCSTSGQSWKSTGDVMQCDLQHGLKCLNSQQGMGRACLDYKVRVFCECGEITHSPFESTTTTKELTTTPFKLTTTTKESTSSPFESTTTTKESTSTPFESTTTTEELTTTKSVPRCDIQLDMDSEYIVKEITTSTLVSKNGVVTDIGLNSENGWNAKLNNKYQWITFEFTREREVTGLITQGTESGWVTSYQLWYSNDGIRFTPYFDQNTGKIANFNGNENEEEYKMNLLKVAETIETRWLRIHPVTWENTISMRINILVSCADEQTPSISTTANVVTTPLCSDGLEWDSCAYNCSTFCNSVALQKYEECKNNNIACIPGCRPNTTCSEGWKLNEFGDCIISDDCSCLLPNGSILAPGVIVTVGKEKCMCFGNEVTCVTTTTIKYESTTPGQQNPTTLGQGETTTLGQEETTILGQEETTPDQGETTTQDQSEVTTSRQKEPTTVSTTKTTTTKVVTTTTVDERSTTPYDDCIWWGDWHNVNLPSSETGDDVEPIRDHILLSTCKKPVAIQCRVEHYNIWFDRSGQKGVTCDVKTGLRCIGKKVEGLIPKCYNYEVRLGCFNISCIPTTPPPTTTILKSTTSNLVTTTTKLVVDTTEGTTTKMTTKVATETPEQATTASTTPPCPNTTQNGSCSSCNTDQYCYKEDCVMIEDCPCVVDGQIYEEEKIWTMGCDTCICFQGIVKCHKKTCIVTSQADCKAMETYVSDDDNCCGTCRCLCGKNENKCESSCECVPEEWWCDNYEDCTDGSDEKLCQLLNTTAQPNYTTTPHTGCIYNGETLEVNQEIKVDECIIIRCVQSGTYEEINICTTLEEKTTKSTTQSTTLSTTTGGEDTTTPEEPFCSVNGNKFAVGVVISEGKCYKVVCIRNNVFKNETTCTTKTPVIVTTKPISTTSPIIESTTSEYVESTTTSSTDSSATTATTLFNGCLYNGILMDVDQEFEIDECNVVTCTEPGVTVQTYVCTTTAETSEPTTTSDGCLYLGERYEVNDIIKSEECYILKCLPFNKLENTTICSTKVILTTTSVQESTTETSEPTTIELEGCIYNGELMKVNQEIKVDECIIIRCVQSGTYEEINTCTTLEKKTTESTTQSTTLSTTTGGEDTTTPEEPFCSVNGIKFTVGVVISEGKCYKVVCIRNNVFKNETTCTTKTPVIVTTKPISTTSPIIESTTSEYVESTTTSSTDSSATTATTLFNGCLYNGILMDVDQEFEIDECNVVTCTEPGVIVQTYVCTTTAETSEPTTTSDGCLYLGERYEVNDIIKSEECYILKCLPFNKLENTTICSTKVILTTTSVQESTTETSEPTTIELEGCIYNGELMKVNQEIKVDECIIIRCVQSGTYEEINTCTTLEKKTTESTTQSTTLSTTTGGEDTTTPEEPFCSVNGIKFTVGVVISEGKCYKVVCIRNNVFKNETTCTTKTPVIVTTKPISTTSPIIESTTSEYVESTTTSSTDSSATTATTLFNGCLYNGILMDVDQEFEIDECNVVTCTEPGVTVQTYVCTTTAETSEPTTTSDGCLYLGERYEVNDIIKSEECYILKCLPFNKLENTTICSTKVILTTTSVQESTTETSESTTIELEGCIYNGELMKVNQEIKVDECIIIRCVQSGTYEEINTCTTLEEKTTESTTQSTTLSTTTGGKDSTTPGESFCSVNGIKFAVGVVISEGKCYKVVCIRNNVFKNETTCTTKTPVIVTTKPISTTSPIIESTTSEYVESTTTSSTDSSATTATTLFNGCLYNGILMDVDQEFEIDECNVVTCTEPGVTVQTYVCTTTAETSEPTTTSDGCLYLGERYEVNDIIKSEECYILKCLPFNKLENTTICSTKVILTTTSVQESTTETSESTTIELEGCIYNGELMKVNQEIKVDECIIIRCVQSGTYEEINTCTTLEEKTTESTTQSTTLSTTNGGEDTTTPEEPFCSVNGIKFTVGVVISEGKCYKVVCIRNNVFKNETTCTTKTPVIVTTKPISTTSPIIESTTSEYVESTTTSSTDSSATTATTLFNGCLYNGILMDVDQEFEIDECNVVTCTEPGVTVQTYVCTTTAETSEPTTTSDGCLYLGERYEVNDIIKSEECYILKCLPFNKLENTTICSTKVILTTTSVLESTTETFESTTIELEGCIYNGELMKVNQEIKVDECIIIRCVQSGTYEEINTCTTLEEKTTESTTQSTTLSTTTGGKDSTTPGESFCSVNGIKFAVGVVISEGKCYKVVCIRNNVFKNETTCTTKTPVIVTTKPISTTSPIIESTTSEYVESTTTSSTDSSATTATTLFNGCLYNGILMDVDQEFEIDECNVVTCTEPGVTVQTYVCTTTAETSEPTTTSDGCLYLGERYEVNDIIKSEECYILKCLPFNKLENTTICSTKVILTTTSVLESTTETFESTTIELEGCIYNGELMKVNQEIKVDECIIIRCVQSGTYEEINTCTTLEEKTTESTTQSTTLSTTTGGKDSTTPGESFCFVNGIKFAVGVVISEGKCYKVVCIRNNVFKNETTCTTKTPVIVTTKPISTTSPIIESTTSEYVESTTTSSTDSSATTATTLFNGCLYNGILMDVDQEFEIDECNVVTCTEPGVTVQTYVCTTTAETSEPTTTSDGCLYLGERYEVNDIIKSEECYILKCLPFNKLENTTICSTKVILTTTSVLESTTETFESTTIELEGCIYNGELMKVNQEIKVDECIIIRCVQSGTYEEINTCTTLEEKTTESTTQSTTLSTTNGGEDTTTPEEPFCSVNGIKFAVGVVISEGKCYKVVCIRNNVFKNETTCTTKTPVIVTTKPISTTSPIIESTTSEYVESTTTSSTDSSATTATTLFNGCLYNGILMDVDQEFEIDECNVVTCTEPGVTVQTYVCTTTAETSEPTTTSDGCLYLGERYEVNDIIKSEECYILKCLPFNKLENTTICSTKVILTTTSVLESTTETFESTTIELEGCIYNGELMKVNQEIKVDECIIIRCVQSGTYEEINTCTTLEEKTTESTTQSTTLSTTNGGEDTTTPEEPFCSVNGIKFAVGVVISEGKCYKVVCIRNNVFKNETTCTTKTPVIVTTKPISTTSPIIESTTSEYVESTTTSSTDSSATTATTLFNGCLYNGILMDVDQEFEIDECNVVTCTEPGVTVQTYVCTTTAETSEPTTTSDGCLYLGERYEVNDIIKSEECYILKCLPFNKLENTTICSTKVILTTTSVQESTTKTSEPTTIELEGCIYNGELMKVNQEIKVDECIIIRCVQSGTYEEINTCTTLEEKTTESTTQSTTLSTTTGGKDSTTPGESFCSVNGIKFAVGVVISEGKCYKVVCIRNNVFKNETTCTTKTPVIVTTKPISTTSPIIESTTSEYVESTTTSSTDSSATTATTLFNGCLYNGILMDVDQEFEIDECNVVTCTEPGVTVQTYVCTTTAETSEPTTTSDGCLYLGERYEVNDIIKSEECYILKCLPFNKLENTTICSTKVILTTTSVQESTTETSESTTIELEGCIYNGELMKVNQEIKVDECIIIRCVQSGTYEEINTCTTLEEKTTESTTQSTTLSTTNGGEDTTTPEEPFCSVNGIKFAVGVVISEGKCYKVVCIRNNVFKNETTCTTRPRTTTQTYRSTTKRSGCVFDGRLMEQGQTWVIDECYYVICEENGLAKLVSNCLSSTISPTKPTTSVPETTPVSGCFYEGSYFPVGGYRPANKRCGNCTCLESNSWSCDFTSCASECIMFSGNAFSTFDNLTYSYQICSHILSKDCVNHTFEIIASLDCTGTNKLDQCRKYLEITTENIQIMLLNRPYVKINGRNHRLRYLPSISQNLQMNGINVTISYVGGEIIVESTNFQVYWKYIQQQARVVVGNAMEGKTCGLCSNNDNDVHNDLELPNHQITNTTKEFGDSWAVMNEEECVKDLSDCTEEKFNSSQTTCEILMTDTFEICHDVVPIDDFMPICIDGMCECLNNSIDADAENKCKCAALAEYAELCQRLFDHPVLTSWRYETNCEPRCPPDQIWRECDSACPKTCQNMMNPQELKREECQRECVSGCFCPEGMVLDGDRCKYPEECDECTCIGWGDPHYMTYDNKYYPFQGNCTYVLSRPIHNEDFEVLGFNEPCTVDPVTSCTKLLSIRFNGHIVELMREHKVTFDGEYVSVPFNSHGFEVSSTLFKLILNIKVIGLYVEFDERNHGFAIKIPIHSYFNKTEGLCGNCNYNPDDDTIRRDGNFTFNTTDFAFSWFVEGNRDETCKHNTTECIPGEPGCCIIGSDTSICDIMKSKAFQKCHLIVDPEDFLSSCVYDVCSGARSCDAIAAYVEACKKNDICIEWRTDELCSSMCEDPLVYNECGLSCAQRCPLFNHSTECNMNGGCFCPDGLFLRNGSCVGLEECPICVDFNGVERSANEEWYMKEGDHCSPICQCTPDGHFTCQSVGCPISVVICAEGEKIIHVNDSTGCCQYPVCVMCDPETDCNKPTPKPICDGAGMVESVQNIEDCCYTYHCSCNKTLCPPAEVPKCEEDKLAVKQLINGSDCCFEYVCVCPETCRNNTIPEIIPFGMKVEIENAGWCCPIRYLVCDDEKCVNKDVLCIEPMVPVTYADPENKCCNLTQCVCDESLCPIVIPPECPEYHQAILSNLPDACCESYSCVCDLSTCPPPLNCSNEHQVVVEGEMQQCCGREQKCQCKECPLVPECDLGESVTVIDHDDICGCDTYKCIRDKCVVNNTEVTVGSEWQEGACTTCRCRATGSGFPFSLCSEKLCPLTENCPEEHRVWDEHGCCYKCDLPLTECSPQVVKTIHLEVDNCISDLEVNVTRCVGACESSTKYSVESNSIEKQCGCCSATRMDPSIISLRCPDGSARFHNFATITECLCESSQCSP